MKSMKYRLLAATAFAAAAVSGVHAEERLNNEQIKSLFSGKTTYGQHAFKDNSGYMYRKEDGTFVAYRKTRGKVTGTWSVKDNMFCRKPDGRDFGCREVYDQGDGTFRFYVQPKNLIKPRKHVWTITKIVDGNPENL
jgi:hypothetical protein